MWEKYLFLGEIIGQVCDHDLGLGWDAISRRTTLAAGLARCLAVLVLGGSRLVSGVSQGEGLAGSGGGLITFLALSLRRHQHTIQGI